MYGPRGTTPLSWTCGASHHRRRGHHHGGGDWGATAHVRALLAITGGLLLRVGTAHPIWALFLHESWCVVRLLLVAPAIADSDVLGVPPWLAQVLLLVVSLAAAD